MKATTNILFFGVYWLTSTNLALADSPPSEVALGIFQPVELQPPKGDCHPGFQLILDRGSLSQQLFAFLVPCKENPRMYPLALQDSNTCGIRTFIGNAGKNSLKIIDSRGYQDFPFCQDFPGDLLVSETVDDQTVTTIFFQR